MKKIGLVLTGGGARAAYQVGVLRAISEICKLENNPFNVISGTSAGSINGAWIGASDERFNEMTHSMWNTWAGLEMNQVFRTDTATLFKTGTRWIKDLSFGGRFLHSNINSLLDPSPLKNFIHSKIDFSKIKKNIVQQKIHGIAITATHYQSGSSVIYFDGHPSISSWNREWRSSCRATLHLDHVLASSAIPIFFPPVQLDGGFYGDGGIMLSAPLSPAIHMGADRILAIGIHHKPGVMPPAKRIDSKSITPGDIAGTLLNSLFFHSIDSDLERMNRINRTLSLLTKEQLLSEPDQLRHIPVLSINPSQDLGKIDLELFNRFPKTIRYLLRGLGASDLRSWDLMSYLAFESEYIKSLLKLGYNDAFEQKEKILKFF